MGKDENQSSGKLQSVLFVCTGNIFRSVTAEYALKARLGEGTSCSVSSAGIDAKPQSAHDWVQTRLREKGADLTAHVQRQLTKELIESSDLVIAMGRDHQVFVREQFGRDVPLFNGSSPSRVGDFGLISYRVEHAGEDFEAQVLLVT